MAGRARGGKRAAGPLPHGRGDGAGRSPCKAVCKPQQPALAQLLLVFRGWISQGHPLSTSSPGHLQSGEHAGFKHLLSLHAFAVTDVELCMPPKDPFKFVRSLAPYLKVAGEVLSMPRPPQSCPAPGLGSAHHWTAVSFVPQALECCCCMVGKFCPIASELAAQTGVSRMPSHRPCVLPRPDLLQRSRASQRQPSGAVPSRCCVCCPFWMRCSASSGTARPPRWTSCSPTCTS